MWLQLIVLVVSVLIQYLTAPKPPVPKPASLSDFTEPVCDDGTPVAWDFGDVWRSGQFVIWWGDLNVQPIKSSGKK